MGKETVRAIIDDREPDEVILAFSNHDEVHDWEVDRLEVGDIQFANSDVIIERKTPGDYNSSLTSGHLVDQVNSMKKVTDNSFVAVEGNLSEMNSYQHSHLSGASIRGSMASIAIRHDVPVIPVSDIDNLVDLSVRMARKSIEEPGRRSISSGPVDSEEPFAKRVLGLIEGIGPDTAQTVYNEYESFTDLMDADSSELSELDGIGEKTGSKIVKQLHED